MIGYGAQAVNVGTPNSTEGGRLSLDKGQYLFSTRCAACHTIGNGDKVGPDLLGVTNVRDRAWLVRSITEPDKLIEEKDPIASALFKKYREIRMPRPGLPEADVNTLIVYMKSQDTTVGNREKAGSQN